MKLIIIEGTDRTGKDTLVNQLMENNVTIKRHWGYPKGETNEEKTLYQKKSFKREFDIYKDFKENSLNNVFMIWNRSHIGEFVYGTIYRNSNPNDWVWKLEKDYEFNVNDIYLILLYADPEFVTSKDDGNSYSSSIEDKAKEINAFLDAFENSLIKNKLKIKVNVENNYTDKNEIYRRVKEFIKI